MKLDEQTRKIIEWLYKDCGNLYLNRKYELSKKFFKQINNKKEIEKQVIYLYNNGHSISYILENTEFKYFRVYRILTDAGIEIRNTNKKKLDEKVENEIIELRKSGKKIKEISKITGVSNPRVSETVRKHINSGDLI